MKSFFKKIKKIDFSKYYPLFFTIFFVVIVFQYSFSTLEAIFYDLRVRHDFGIKGQDNVVLITMDEVSDEFLGESYPYTYASHDRLLDRLIKENPRAVGYLVNFLEPEDDADVQYYNTFKKRINDFILNGGIFRFGTDMDNWGEQLPPNELKGFGYSLALVNVDNAAFAKDDVSRRAILNYSGEESFHSWMANTYRRQLGRGSLDINEVQGAYYLREADATFALFRYYTSPLSDHGAIKKIPFHRVHTGNFPKGFFKDKIVLIGSSYISNGSDFVLTPYSKEEYKSSKLAVHAEIIEALIQGKTVYSVPRNITYALAILIAIFLSIIISKIKPTRGLIITLLVMFGILFSSYLLFSLFGYWLYVTHLVLTVFVVYYIWVPFRAIGEYQRRFAIQEETKLLKKVEDLKQNFISLMSHDLKTPVAKIAGIADVMKTQGMGDKKLYDKNLTSIVDSTKELNRFITSILDLTKIESRNLNLNLTSKDVNTLVEDTVESLKYEASVKNVAVLTELGPLYPIQCDVNLMKRVLSNLVENAIKYSGENTQVEIKTWDDEEWIYIKITDNGVGISSDDLENIFEKFYRVKNDASHKIKGTGLGLYLVKYFVELHGGFISAESELGNGTSFLLKFKNA